MHIGLFLQIRKSFCEVRSCEVDGPEVEHSERHSRARMNGRNKRKKYSPRKSFQRYKCLYLIHNYLQANQRVEEFKRQLKTLTVKLKEAEARAEFAEKTVKKLQKEVDRLEGGPLDSNCFDNVFLVVSKNGGEIELKKEIQNQSSLHVFCLFSFRRIGHQQGQIQVVGRRDGLDVR